MKNHVLRFLLSVACISILSCKGDTGPQGPQGIVGNSSDGILSMTFQAGVLPYTGYGGCVDTYISSGTPTSNFSGENYTSVGRSVSATYRSLIKFDISSIIPSNVQVKAAYLSFSNSYNQTSIQPIAAYKVTQFWDNNVTWNTYNGTTSWPLGPGGRYDAVAVSDTTRIGGYSLDFVLKLDNTLVSDWLTNSITNFGVILRSTNEGTTNYGVYVNYSADHVNIEARPKLTIYYTLP